MKFVRVTICSAGVALILAVMGPTAAGYIHFPPMTLQKMCKDSHQIRLLKITKHDREKGVILFEVMESFKDRKAQIDSFKHVLRTEAEGVKPILDWVDDGKTAVMFSIETQPGFAALGIGYVFIEKYCYSVDYNRKGKYWFLVRAEPQMSACYHGSVEQLGQLIPDILGGKEVTVPLKQPDSKDDEKRREQVNDALKINRKDSPW